MASQRRRLEKQPNPKQGGVWITPVLLATFVVILLWLDRGNHNAETTKRKVRPTNTSNKSISKGGVRDALTITSRSSLVTPDPPKTTVTFGSMDTSGGWARSVPLLKETACMLKRASRTPLVATVQFQVPPADEKKSSIEGWTKSTANRCSNDGKVALDSVNFVNDSATALAARAQAGKRNKNKAARIRVLRNSFRKKLSEDRPNALVLFDGDMRKLPSPEEISKSVLLILKGSSWDVLCSNGQMGHSHQARYYDTFATILKNGTYPFKELYLDVKEHGRNPQRERVLNHQFFSRLDATDEIVPVQSCFGGLAVYNSRYFTPECNYSYSQIPESYVPRHYHAILQAPCEHIAMHLCLNASGRASQHSFSAGVVTNMKTWWGGT